MSSHTKVPPELEDLANQIGEFIEYWGFKKVHGRIWTHIYLADQPLDAADLIQRLHISKALVSMSLSDLLEYEVIKVAGKSERGTVTYSANTEVTDVILNVLRKRERRMLSHILAAYKLVKDLPRDDKKNVKIDARRVKALGEMVRSAETALEGFLAMSSVDFDKWGQFNNENT